MTRIHSTRAVLLSLLLGLCASTAFPARVPPEGTPQKAARKPTTRIKMAPQHDNGESGADRDRRLRRECRGLPNGGACSGYGYGS